MARLLGIKEGWTGEIGPFTLRANGAPFSLSGFTVSIVLTKADGTVVDSPGTVSKANQISFPGQVYFTPAADIWQASASPYSVSWRVVDGASKVEYFPNEASDQISVTKP